MYTNNNESSKSIRKQKESILTRLGGEMMQKCDFLKIRSKNNRKICFSAHRSMLLMANDEETCEGDHPVPFRIKTPPKI